mmetsp:Transcript_8413/g.18425  ORF Transcript_8413/g.18425 Transcript_8413/m.18425 type:complete len:93 (+) Transcript_8413:1-279(+)
MTLGTGADQNDAVVSTEEPDAPFEVPFGIKLGNSENGVLHLTTPVSVASPDFQLTDDVIRKLALIREMAQAPQAAAVAAATAAGLPPPTQVH